MPDFVILPTDLGNIASYYYLKHGTMKILHDRLRAQSSLSDLLAVLCDVKEFDEMPVRHNEDAENGSVVFSYFLSLYGLLYKRDWIRINFLGFWNRLLSKKVPLPIEASRYDDPHAKVFLLLQVYFSRNEIPMPHVDYATDLKTVQDQVMRVLQVR